MTNATAVDVDTDAIEPAPGDRHGLGGEGLGVGAAAAGGIVGHRLQVLEHLPEPHLRALGGVLLGVHIPYMSQHTPIVTRLARVLQPGSTVRAACADE